MIRYVTYTLKNAYNRTYTPIPRSLLLMVQDINYLSLSFKCFGFYLVTWTQSPVVENNTVETYFSVRKIGDDTTS